MARSVSLLLLLAVNLLQADYLKYAFDGDLDEHFQPSTLPDNTFPLQQVAGRLVYHNDGATAEDSTTIYELKNFSPTVADSWTFSAEVTIPNLVRSAELGADPQLFAGLGCYNRKTDQLRFMTHVFEIDFDGARTVRTQTGIDEDELRGELQVLNETITVRIRYDGGVFTLLRTNQETGSDTLFSLDIDDEGFASSPNLLDWGLEPEDALSVFVIFNSKDYPIQPDIPVQMDNLYFVMHNTDEEDGGIQRDEQLLNVEVKAFPSGFSVLQKSHDLENWITIKSLRKGVRVNMLLPSDNGQAHYRVVKVQ